MQGISCYVYMLRSRRKQQLAAFTVISLNADTKTQALASLSLSTLLLDLNQAVSLMLVTTINSQSSDRPVRSLKYDEIQHNDFPFDC